MSQENVDLARKGYAAFSDFGVEGILELLDPNVEWRTTSDQPDPAVYHGHEGVRRVIGGQLEAFDSFQIDVEDVIDAGEFVVVETRIHVRGRGSGLEVEISETHLHEIRGGRSVRVQEYRTKQEVLEAAGLSGG